MSASTKNISMPPAAKKAKTTNETPKPKRSPNKWLTHYHNWRKKNVTFCTNNRDVKAWVAEAKKTYVPVVHTYTCKKCHYVNVI